MKKTFAVALVSVLLLAGCAARGVRVAELKDQPGRYATKSVSVNGVVTSSWGIPLVPFQLYNVDDGSGEITVLVAFRPRCARTWHQGPGQGTDHANLRCSEVDRSAFTCRKRTARSSPNLDRHRGHVVVVRRMPRNSLASSKIASTISRAVPPR